MRQEILTIEQLHREEARGLVDDKVVQRDQVRMAQIGQTSELALELVDLLDVGIGDRLERDLLAALLVVSLVHDTHSAGADSPHDVVPAGASRFLDHPLTILVDQPPRMRRWRPRS